MDRSLGTRLALSLSLILMATANPIGAQTQRFTPTDILTWPSRDFAQPVDYRLTEIGGRTAVHARCTGGSASALYLEQSIDLGATPILRWHWFVPELSTTPASEQIKAGDDFPVRIYAVHSGGLLPWRTQAVNYVWSREIATETAWPNPFTDNAMMLSVQSGAEQTGQWLRFERNLQADFQRLHDKAVEHIDGLAIMSDCDNTEVSSEGAFGTIQLRAATHGP